MKESKTVTTINSPLPDDKLWDEITKSIADHMPNQLFPLFQEAFGKTYPKNTPIRLIQTEYPIPSKTTTDKISSIYSDITLLVNESDLYHIECQMTNDKDMVIRMIEYDFHFALRHGIQMESPNVYTLYFPNSTVIYPEKNDNIPENLLCRIIFPDGSIHQYNIPTMKIQMYSLEDIRQKHLTMFLPFKLLSFRPRIKSKSNPIRVNELTEYINQIIVILKDEYHNGSLSNHEYKDYLSLINLAAERVFHSQPNLKEEVLNVTKSVLILPSDLYREAEQAKLLRKELDEKNASLSEKEKTIAQQAAENAKLLKQIEELQKQFNSK